jgi:hypothetical protein
LDVLRDDPVRVHLPLPATVDDVKAVLVRADLLALQDVGLLHLDRAVEVANERSERASQRGRDVVVRGKGQMCTGQRCRVASNETCWSRVAFKCRQRGLRVDAEWVDGDAWPFSRSGRRMGLMRVTWGGGPPC